MTKLLNEQERRTEIARIVTGNLSPLAKVEALDRLVLAHAESLERTWYVVDKDTVDEGGTIIVGPFTTSADAAVAREYIERKDPRDRTYWLEQRERNK